MTRQATPAVRVVPLAELGPVDRGWTRGHAHFGFDGMPPETPGFLRFGPLGLATLERIDAGEGYAMHPHREAEIVTVLFEGALEHEDSLGRGARTETDDVAVMTAGTGIRHAELASADGPVVAMQIWVRPHTAGLEPSATQRRFPREERVGRWVTVASGRPDAPAGALVVHQDAAVRLAVLGPGDAVGHVVENGRRAYVVAVGGAIAVCGERVEPGERVLAEDPGALRIQAIQHTEVVLLDLP